MTLACVESLPEEVRFSSRAGAFSFYGTLTAASCPRRCFADPVRCDSDEGIGSLEALRDRDE